MVAVQRDDEDESGTHEGESVNYSDYQTQAINIANKSRNGRFELSYKKVAFLLLPIALPS